jgi:hypothetical protein
VPWRATAPLALLAAALHFSPHSEAFVSIWPPHVLVMPFLCFLVACVSVAVGCIAHLPVLILAGGFLFHGHVAQPLFVGGLGALALVLYVRRKRLEIRNSWRELARDHRHLLMVCAMLLFAFLLPPAIDVISRGLRSNVATIIGQFVTTRESGNTVLQSLLYFLSFATPAEDQDVVFATIGAHSRDFFLQHAARIGAWLVVLILPTLLAWRFERELSPETRRFFLTAGIFLAATVALCVVWGMSQLGGMYHFNGYFYHAIYYFGLLIALGLAARSLERFRLALPGVLACAMAAVVVTNSFHAHKLTGGEAGLDIQQATAAALAGDPDPRPKLLVFDHNHWPKAVSVGLELNRRGVEFYSPSWWAFMLQRRHDVSRLAAAPEDRVSIWWITPPDSGGHVIEPGLSIHTQPSPIHPAAAEITFDESGNAFRHVVLGFSVGDIGYASTNEQRALLRFAPQPADRAVRITFDAQADNEASTEVAADVFFNGNPVGRASVGPRACVSVTVAPEQWNRGPVATLELRFPNAIHHRPLRRPDYEWWSAWRLWSIRFAPVEL